MRITSRKVEIQPSFAPKTKSGTSKTTGGTTINETRAKRSVSRPRNRQREKPQPASEASASVIATEDVVRIALFANQRGNWSLSAASKPCSVGRSDGVNGCATKPDCVLNAAVS